jgi:quinol monooxygenase YgiN
MIVELRQYTLHPGKRDTLIDLFEREFIESQEAAGMHLLGLFRDLDDPNRFVWLRGFPDMPARAQALGAFYGGPVWKAHRDAANATMIDSDNVLLLRPARVSDAGQRRNEKSRDGTIIATVYYFASPVDEAFIERFERTLLPQLNGDILGHFVTEYSANNFPALPVRSHEHAFVWVARIGDADLEPVRETSDMLARQSHRSPEVHRLSSTPRSRF